MNPLATGIAILPYGVGLFLGPLASTPLRCACGPLCWASAWRSRWRAMRPYMVAGFTQLTVRCCRR